MVSEGSALDPRPRLRGTGPRLGRIQDRVLHVLSEVDAGAPADRALQNAWRRARDLGSHERRQVREEVYGLLRHRRRAQDAVERGLSRAKKSPSLFDPPVKLRLELLAHLALEGANLAEIEDRDPYAARRVPNLMARIAEGRLPVPRGTSMERRAISFSLPTWLYRRFEAGLGEREADRVASALLDRAPLTLRVDPNRLDRARYLQALETEGLSGRPTPYAPYGIIIESRTDLRNRPELQDGRVEVQDEGSQLAALAVGAQPGERILDGCAGAGGKTLALWAAMEARGEIVALEPDPKKREALERRLKSADATTLKTTGMALESLSADLRGTFDRVLVDAPCTGTGTLRRHPDLKWRLADADVEQEAARQLRLLGAALTAVRPGGILVYVTCSVLREENEAVAEAFAQTAPELQPVGLDTLWGPSLASRLGARGAMARIGPGPDSTGPDGFFIAAFRRRPSEVNSSQAIRAT